MSFEEIVTRYLHVNRIDQVLVCEATLTELRGAVIQKKNDKLVISPRVYAESADMQAAVSEMINKVRHQGWKGRQAILLTPSVLMTPLELRIPHKNRLEPEQIAESVRWEVEPLMTPHRALAAIGQILVANRCLTPQRLEELLEAQRELAQSKQREVIYKRLGELAIERGYLTPNRLEQCLVRQRWFIHEEESLKCGWVSLKNHVPTEPGQFGWLVSAMSLALLRQWQAAFAQQAIKLEAAYPLTGSTLSAPGLPFAQTKKEPTTQSQQEVVLELHPFEVSATVLQQGTVYLHQVLPCHAENQLAQLTELYHGLGLSGETRVMFADFQSDAEETSHQILQDLEQMLGCAVSLLKQPASGVGLALPGAAAHFMGLQTGPLLVAVSVHPPLPPPMQRLSVRLVMAVASLLMMILCAELFMMGQTFWIEYREHAIAEDLGKINDATKRIQEKINKTNKLKEELNVLKEENKTVEAMIKLLGNTLPQRNKSVMDFLSSFEGTVTEDVVIDKLMEDTIAGFTVYAWALNEQSAQMFIKNFQLAVHPQGYKLKDITVNQETGRLGLVGYAIHFNATTLSDQAWAERKLNPNASVKALTNDKSQGNK